MPSAAFAADGTFAGSANGTATAANSAITGAAQASSFPQALDQVNGATSLALTGDTTGTST